MTRVRKAARWRLYSSNYFAGLRVFRKWDFFFPRTKEFSVDSGDREKGIFLYHYIPYCYDFLAEVGTPDANAYSNHKQPQILNLITS
ncbi:MAG: hypothetical protein SynsKO_25980 [Synoicihabitans sp.]